MRLAIKHCVEDFRRIGWDVRDSQGTMFVWAKIPEGMHRL